MQRLLDLLQSYESFRFLIIKENDWLETKLSKNLNELANKWNIAINEDIKNNNRHLKDLDNAFFILCWAVIEFHIDQQCRELLRSKRLSPEWEVRRSFDIHNPDDDKIGGLSFENKLKLLINRENHRDVNGLIIQLYKQRNRLAHGKELQQSIDLKGYYTLTEDLDKAITL